MSEVGKNLEVSRAGWLERPAVGPEALALFEAQREWIREQIIGLVPIREIAARAGYADRTFRYWLYSEVNREWFFAVKREAAETWVEEAKGEFDEAKGLGEDLTISQATRLREYTRHCQWMASRLDRKLYGDSPSVQVNTQVNLGVLHLDSLRKYGGMEVGE